LKKGYALVALGKRDSAVREFRSLISQHPNTQEARAARDELEYLGASKSRRQNQ
jgi:TolA-binding protein